MPYTHVVRMNHAHRQQVGRGPNNADNHGLLVTIDQEQVEYIKEGELNIVAAKDISQLQVARL